MATTRVFLLLTSWLLTAVAAAQQLPGEHLWLGPTTQPGLYAADLLRLQPDSLRLLADYQTGAPSFSYDVRPTTTALRRVLVDACDTLPVPGGRFQADNMFTGTLAIVTRRGQVLVGSSRRPYAARPVELRLFGRDGRLRWLRQLPVVVSPQSVNGLLEAPDRGFFVGVGPSGVGYSYLFRLDSLGNVVWQRVLSRHRVGGPICFYDPVYTRAGTILFHPRAVLSGRVGTGVMEISQNGDSLTTRLATADAQQSSHFNELVSGSLQPLQDGGFLVVSQVDSAGTGYFRPCLTRLNQGLQVAWSTLYRPQATKGYEFTHPYELTDGSLLVSVRTNQSGYQEPFWLFRYSAAGVLLQRYAFNSPAIAALRTSLPTSSYGPFFTAPVGLQPLADSTFMLADNLAVISSEGYRRQALYLAHLKVPGLRRVLDSHYIPAVNSPLAIQLRGGFPAPAYPNPARDWVNVPLPAAGPAGQLRLLDILGRTVCTQPVAAGAMQSRLVVADVASGVYVLQLEIPGQPMRSQRLAIGP